MTLTRLLHRSLTFHRRANLALLLGVAVGTAVLTGALLVGDSLRGSLRDRALGQLDGVKEAMVGGRFVRAEIADEINRTTQGAEASADLLKSRIMMRATAEADDNLRARQTLLFGEPGTTCR